MLVLVGGPLLYLSRRRDGRRERVRSVLRRRLDGDRRARRARGGAPARARPRSAVNHEELGAQLREHALLEGDFVLRSGRRSTYYLDKYRFETTPDLLGPLGERLAGAVQEFEPGSVRLAAPALGAVALAASASLASGLPFLIVRDTPRATAPATGSKGRTSRASWSA